MIFRGLGVLNCKKQIFLDLECGLGPSVRSIVRRDARARWVTIGGAEKDASESLRSE